MKLMGNRFRVDKRKDLLTQCIIKIRNSLPKIGLMPKSINGFKGELRKLMKGDISGYWPCSCSQAVYLQITKLGSIIRERPRPWPSVVTNWPLHERLLDWMIQQDSCLCSCSRLEQSNCYQHHLFFPFITKCSVCL